MVGEATLLVGFMAFLPTLWEYVRLGPLVHSLLKHGFIFYQFVLLPFFITRFGKLY